MKTIQLRAGTRSSTASTTPSWPGGRNGCRASGRRPGFAIEFAYGLPETNEFVWAVSAEGDEEAFLAREEVYMASDARAEAFAGLPQRVAEYNIRFVDEIA